MDPPEVTRAARRAAALPPGKVKRMAERKVAHMRREYEEKERGIRTDERGDT